MLLADADHATAVLALEGLSNGVYDAMFLLLAESIIDPQKINLSLKIALDRITVD
jgi:hypothetical protein